MDKEVVLWIFGIVITMNSAIHAWTITTIISMIRGQAMMEATLSFMGYNAAKAAHSPHNPALDILLEKYYRVYEEKHYDMSDSEWEELKNACQEIVGDLSLPNGYRAAVGIVLALCKHKQMRCCNSDKL